MLILLFLKVASWFVIRLPRVFSIFAPMLNDLISSVFFCVGTNLCSSSFLLSSLFRPLVKFLISCMPDAAEMLRLPPGCRWSLGVDSSISTVANDGEVEKVE